MPIRLDDLPLIILLGLLKHIDSPPYSDKMFQDHVIFYIDIASRLIILRVIFLYLTRTAGILLRCSQV